MPGTFWGADFSLVILGKMMSICDKISPFVLGIGNFVFIFEKIAAIGAIYSSEGSFPDAIAPSSAGIAVSIRLSEYLSIAYVKEYRITWSTPCSGSHDSILEIPEYILNIIAATLRRFSNGPIMVSCSSRSFKRWKQVTRKERSNGNTSVPMVSVDDEDGISPISRRSVLGGLVPSICSTVCPRIAGGWFLSKNITCLSFCAEISSSSYLKNSSRAGPCVFWNASSQLRDRPKYRLIISARIVSELSVSTVQPSFRHSRVISLAQKGFPIAGIPIGRIMIKVFVFWGGDCVDFEGETGLGFGMDFGVAGIGLAGGAADFIAGGARRMGCFSSS